MSLLSLGHEVQYPEAYGLTINYVSTSFKGWRRNKLGFTSTW